MTIDKEKLKALAEVATEGQWQFDGGTVNDWREGEYSMEWMPNGEDCEDGTNANWKADGEYIAAASPATVLALLAEIERHEAWRTAFLAERDAQMRQRDQLRAENDGLRKALLEASEEVATWGAYASEYFQEKHDLAGCVAKIHAAAMAKEAAHD